MHNIPPHVRQCHEGFPDMWASAAGLQGVLNLAGRSTMIDDAPMPRPRATDADVPLSPSGTSRHGTGSGSL